ncbi:hypothetical protein Taro_026698, partial [Colocasia esculenta]|nr:hypothetical protein [Colocasia esculenta]
MVLVVVFWWVFPERCLGGSGGERLLGLWVEVLPKLPCVSQLRWWNFMCLHGREVGFISRALWALPDGGLVALSVVRQALVVASVWVSPLALGSECVRFGSVEVDAFFLWLRSRWVSWSDHEDDLGKIYVAMELPVATVIQVPTTRRAGVLERLSGCRGIQVGRILVAVGAAVALRVLPPSLSPAVEHGGAAGGSCGVGAASWEREGGGHCVVKAPLWVGSSFS